MRQENCLNYYKPGAISIGPIHNGSKEVMLKDLEFKENLASKFIKDSGKSGEDLLGEIKAVIGDLKNCFDEAVISTPMGMIRWPGCCSWMVVHLCSSYTAVRLARFWDSR